MNVLSLSSCWYICIDVIISVAVACWEDEMRGRCCCKWPENHDAQTAGIPVRKPPPSPSRSSHILPHFSERGKYDSTYRLLHKCVAWWWKMRCALLSCDLITLRLGEKSPGSPAVSESVWWALRGITLPLLSLVWWDISLTVLQYISTGHGFISSSFHWT